MLSQFVLVAGLNVKTTAGLLVLLVVVVTVRLFFDTTSAVATLSARQHQHDLLMLPLEPNLGIHTEGNLAGARKLKGNDRWLVQRQLPSPNLEPALHSSASNSFPPCESADYFCVAWDVPTDNWWTHAHQWTTDTENETHQCFARISNRLKANLYQRLYRNQWHGDCSRVYSRFMYSSGWGSDLENVVLGLQKALFSHAPFVVTLQPPFLWWHYAATKATGENPTCDSRDMYCYFLPIGNCTAGPVDRDAVVMTRHFAQDFSAVQEYVTKPQQWLRKAVFEYARHITLPQDGNCTIMHVRRGDVVMHGRMARRYFPISAYVEKMPRPNDPILLLTDDQNAIDEAHEFFPHLNWLYFNRARHRGTSGGWENVNPSNSPRSEVVVILATLKLVKQCNTLIHSRSKFSDTLSRAMPGKGTQRLRVDENTTMMDASNQNSDIELEQLLSKQREKQQLSRRE